MVSIPPASATFINPRKRVITPTSPSASSTEPVAESTIALESISMGGTPPASGVQTTCRQAAVQTAANTMKKKMKFIISNVSPSKNGCW